jgi:two-component system cell cycle response regulator CtrA
MVPHKKLNRPRIDTLDDAMEWIAQLEKALGQTTAYALPLTSAETRILGALHARTGVVTREAVYSLLYSTCNDPPDDRIIDVFLSRIRQKLRPHGIEITTFWGVGWMIDADSRRALDKFTITDEVAA